MEDAAVTVSWGRLQNIVTAPATSAIAPLLDETAAWNLWPLASTKHHEKNLT